MTILGQCLWWLRRRGRRVALIAKFLTSVEARRTTRKKFGQSLRKFGNWARQARHVLRKGEMLRQARGRLAGHLVQVGHGLVRKVLVHYEADVYHSGVNVGLELPDVASLKAAP